MTKVVSGAVAACLGLLVASCGGSDGGGGGGAVGVVPAPTPTATPSPAATPLSVSITPADASLTGYDDGSDVTLTVEATVSGTTTDTVVPDVQDDRTKLTIADGIEPNGSGRYIIRARTARGLALGTYTGDLTFRLCRDAGCGSVHAETTQTVRYTLTVQMRDWSMFQRNPAHTGYVHATFAPSAFRRAWEWTPSVSRLSLPASYKDTVLVTASNRDGTTSIHALDVASGAQRWGYNIGQVHSSSGPAVGGNRLFITTMSTSSSENRILTLDAGTGEFRPPVMLFASQWSSFLPPTPYGDGLYMSAGYFGNALYGFDVISRQGWSAQPEKGGIWDGQTPAVDDRYVYYYSGGAMVQVDRRTGTIREEMADPFFQGSSGSYYGAPILGSRGNVMAYAGTRGASSSSALASWAPGSGLRWRSADAYVTTPAVGDGTIYLSRNQPARLDALNESTGAQVWSWTPPADERFIANTIATDTLVFVSTDKAIYAISLTDPAHPAVWSAPTPGAMAITADGTLVVTQTLPTSAYSGWSEPQKIVAYRLK